ncbi:hypothetical protein RFI_05212 [Reticulomyxa filosa]|uniref:Uncharacterized protein n=1 Tax=Reticulomyxa filosa TaxID=46433 RepID=X6P1B4_RETFI|nr:hypothetical protein RFI_05212 [Reticulomyxa filosa]|eukprot:ETO31903.1 hypothetical protein RFI_05212 [Reticulomyxa filosa]
MSSEPKTASIVDDFTGHYGRAPETLQDLVEKSYATLVNTQKKFQRKNGQEANVQPIDKGVSTNEKYAPWGVPVASTTTTASLTTSSTTTTFVSLTLGYDILKDYDTFVNKDLPTQDQITIENTDEDLRKVIQWVNVNKEIYKDKLNDITIALLQQSYAQYQNYKNMNSSYAKSHKKFKRTVHCINKAPKEEKETEEAENEDGNAEEKEDKKEKIEVAMKSIDQIIEDKTVLDLYHKFEQQNGYPPKDAKLLFSQMKDIYFLFVHCLFGQEYHKDLEVRFDEIKVEMDRLEKEKARYEESVKQLEEQKAKENKSKPLEQYDLAECLKEFRSQSKHAKIVEDEKFLQKLHSFITLEKGYSIKFADFKKDWDAYIGKESKKTKKKQVCFNTSFFVYLCFIYILYGAICIYASFFWLEIDRNETMQIYQNLQKN